MNTRLYSAITGALVFGCVLSTAAVAGTTNPNVEYRPTGKGYGVPVGGREIHRPGKPTGGGGKPTTDITAHGGPVMLGSVNVYYIWYGNWGTASGGQAQPLLVNLAQSLGGSPYFNINKTYYNPSNVHVSGSVTFMGSTNDNLSQGSASTSLSDAQILNIVTLALNSHVFGPSPDPNGVYFVLTAADVHKSGFGTSYCGWHTRASIGGVDVKYSFVGDPSTQYPGSCGDQAVGPNGSSGGDAMASVLSHELEEATTDPDLNAWYDRSGAENADKCAWTFGTTSTASNGALYNVTLGGTKYLIQRNWSASTQACGMN